MYSSASIRWVNYPGLSEEKKLILEKICDWWKNQDNQKFEILHILEYDGAPLAWKPTKNHPPVQTIILNPNAEYDQTQDLVVFLYSDQNNKQERILTYAIDLDIQRSNLFVWFGDPQQVIKFSKI
ncbi:MAG: hypothetical protein RMY34_09895 [Aulosira sp. DedQUE10]|nr:hypothetical protein [Aulosira sp. DedQUE10]